MTEYTYFGNRGSITVGGETIAVLKGIEVNVTFEHEELYGMDSILRQDVAKHTAAVEVKISAAKFDPAMGAGTWRSLWLGTQRSSYLYCNLNHRY